MKRGMDGFSLLEVLVAAGLLAFLISFAMKKMSLQEENMTLLEKRMKARHLMDRSISRLAAELRTFPPLTRNSGRSAMTYVACFDKGGDSVESTAKSAEFVAVDLKDATVSSQICGKSSFEAHVIPALDRMKSATVHILSFDLTQQKQILVYSTELVLQGSI